MILKKCLSVSLALSMALSPCVGLAQTTPSQLDAVGLLLESLKAKNAQDAHNMIQMAREKLKSEQLPESSQQRINDLLDLALKRLSARPNEPIGGGAIPNERRSEDSRDRGKFGGATLPADLNDELQKLLGDNPDVRNSMWEIGQGRLTRDAGKVDSIVRNRTGQTPIEHDKNEQRNLDQANQPGALLSYLRSKGLIKQSYTAENRALREQFKGAPIDDLADYLINRAVAFSAGSSLTASVVELISQQSQIKTLSMFGQLSGISAEALVTFIINANLTLQIADLYGLKMRAYEEESLVLAVLAVAKFGTRFSFRAPEMRQLIFDVGTKIGDSRVAKAGGNWNFLNKLVAHPVIANSLRSATPDQPNKPDADHASVDENGGNGARKAPQPQQPQPQKPVARSFATRAIFAGLMTAWSTLETYGVGQAAKGILGTARQRERARMNDLFRRYLMTPDGEGFFKLLVLSVNVGQPSVDPIDLKNPADPKAKFILNLARSARICSPQDMKRWASAVSGGDINASEKSMLQYACDTNLSQARYARLITEFQTFNEIPQDFVANLRIAGREDRLRMGELLLQMQFLDGDRDPKEVLYFNEVVTKYFGFTTRDDLDYFAQLQSFIIENGGMKENAASPTGFTVADQSKPNPYDLSIGYMTTRGPEVPLKASGIPNQQGSGQQGSGQSQGRGNDSSNDDEDSSDSSSQSSSSTGGAGSVIRRATGR